MSNNTLTRRQVLASAAAGAAMLPLRGFAADIVPNPRGNSASVSRPLALANAQKPTRQPKSR